jgi:nickel transport protein
LRNVSWRLFFSPSTSSIILSERGDGTTPVAEKHIPRLTTDAEGIAAIPIVKAGPHLLVIDHTVKPSANPDQANSDLFTATLWFNIARATN